MSVAAIAAAAAAVVNAHMLPDACELQTDLNASTSDSAGGSAAPNWVTVASCRCQVSAITAREATVAEKLSEVADYQITLPAGTTVTATQRIKHTEGAVTTYYGIVGVRASKTFELARTVLAEVVSP